MERRFAVGLALIAAVLGALAWLPDGGAQGSSVRFAVIGDYGFAGEPARAVADLVASWAPDFIVTTGDNNYPLGAASTIDENIGQYYHAFIHPYRGRYGAGATVNRFFPTPGNHDWEAPGLGPYRAYFTLPGNERYYETRWGPVHLFAVDSDSREPDGHRADSVQAAWLRAALAASTAPWKIVAMHHPPHSSGPHGPAVNVRWPFPEWGADAVLTGHDHLYERVTIDDFPYFVNGLGGASRYAIGVPVPGSQVRFSAEHGAMLVEADADQITFRCFTKSGALIDTYTLYTSPGSHRPAAPGGLVAEAVSGREVDLAWVDNASNEAEVVVEAAPAGGTFAPVATLGRNATDHALAALSPMTTYQFRVVARNAAGASVPSPPAAATTKAAGPPPAPRSFTARPATATGVELAWVDAGDNERGFVVEQSSGAGFAPLASVDRDTTEFITSGLEGGITYQFRVRAHNADGSSAWSGMAASMTARPDLRVTALTGVPGVASPGDKMTLSTRTANDGNVAAPESSATRFYLAPEGGGPRVLLGGTVSVGRLAPGAGASSAKGIAIPDTVAPGRYGIEACADDKQALLEHDEANNCRAAGPVQLGRPDLLMVSVTPGDTRVRSGERLPVSDTVRNAGTAPAARSSVRYYLSLSGRLDGGARLLKGGRTVSDLEPGAISTGNPRPTVPPATPPGSYRLLACADDTRKVAEESETNNCLAGVAVVEVVP